MGILVDIDSKKVKPDFSFEDLNIQKEKARTVKTKISEIAKKCKPLEAFVMYS